MIKILEGNRRSGKSFLCHSQKTYPLFKFDFNECFSGLNFKKDSSDIHFLGLGKELMLHQLNRDGFLNGDFIVDRGIITNSVWGVFQKRISLEQAERELLWSINSGLLVRSSFIGIIGVSPEGRSKDIWDSEDSRAQEEIDLFNHFYELMESNGIPIKRFVNNFNEESEKEFIEFIKL